MKALDLPRDLTLPGPGSTTARGLVSGGLRRVMGEAPALLAEAAREARASGFAPWASALVREPGAAASLLRRPHLGALVRVLRSAEGAARAPLLLELLSTLAYELTVTGAPLPPLTLERLPPRIVALAARRAFDIPPDTLRATFAPGETLLHGADGSLPPPPRGGGQGGGTIADGGPYAVIAEPIVLALEDNNPLALVEAHPDKSGNRVDLGGKTTREWVVALRGALDVVAAGLPDVRAELDVVLEAIVPVGFDSEKHLSASYREATGTVYLSLSPDPLTMAEALVHEASHTKLNLLFEQDPVFENDEGAVFASPVRPDPRPLTGVLLAVHAFLAIEGLYLGLRDAQHPLSLAPTFGPRLRDVSAKNEEGLEDVARHARPTPAGRALIDEMTRLGARFREARRALLS